MTKIVVRREVTIASPNGLHARPADLFARMANRYESVIEVIKDKEHVNGKSTLEILMLAAVQGTILTIQASGRDAREAVEALARLIEEQVAALDAEAAADSHSINTTTGPVRRMPDRID
jgi:phosphotransferase system HPr (HPr) family protein